MADRIYLVRHAEPAYPNGRPCWLGRTVNVPLSDAGRLQARDAAKVLHGAGIEAVYTSPLLRAAETARIIAGELPLAVLTELQELSSGEWDGMERSELRRLYPAYFAKGGPKMVPPGGESDQEGIARALKALQILSDVPFGTVAAVTHGGIGRLLLCRLLGLELDRKHEIGMSCASIALLERIDGTWHVREREDKE